MKRLAIAVSILAIGAAGVAAATDPSSAMIAANTNAQSARVNELVVNTSRLRKRTTVSLEYDVHVKVSKIRADYHGSGWRKIGGDARDRLLFILAN